MGLMVGPFADLKKKYVSVFELCKQQIASIRKSLKIQKHIVHWHSLDALVVQWI